MMTFYVYGQQLRMKYTVVASNTIDYLAARFVFQTEDWDGAAKTAVFEGTGKTYSVLLTNDAIRPEDHLNLAAGEWIVHVVGTKTVGETTQRITTTQVRFMVDESGALSGEELPEVTASYGEQILAQAQEARNIAKGVRDDADAGKFKGDKGDTGPAGPQGETGPKGPQGDTGPKGDPGEKGDKGAQGETGPKGADGTTPHIGDNGNWYIGDDDTGKPSRGAAGANGKDGTPGDDGAPGIVISSEEPTDPSHPVWIDPEGDETPDNPLGITGAAVGQIAKITAVDGTGLPIAWEPVDITAGDTWELINTFEVAEADAARVIKIDKDSSGNAFSLKAFAFSANTNSTKTDGSVYGWFCVNGRGIYNSGACGFVTNFVRHPSTGTAIYNDVIGRVLPFGLVYDHTTGRKATAGVQNRTVSDVHEVEFAGYQHAENQLYGTFQLWGVRK